MPVKPKILVVDDEPDARELISVNLQAAGYGVVTAEDGPVAVRKAREQMPALIILDLMLPTVDGLEVCKQLKSDPATRSIPVIMLTAKSGEVDRVVGFELGADDYVTKPFSPRELVLRVKALLRRAAGSRDSTEKLRIGPLCIDLPRHVVTVQNVRVELTTTEFKLLTTLAQSEGRVLTRDALLQHVWEYEAMIDTRTVDTHIRRLREKLGVAAKHIDTVRGTGYRWVHG